MSNIKLRPATGADAQAILAIYAPYVRETAITFEYETPTIAQFRARIEQTIGAYPYLVAEGQSGIVGYALAGPFRERAAYAWCAETTVYVAPSVHRTGVGRILYETLLDILTRQGVKNAYACITWPNEASIAFHQALGFKPVARLSRCGYKLDQWWDSVWMEKFLGGHEAPPAPLLPVAKVLAQAGLV